MRTERYDIIIIGSGAGGGTMAHALADSPARILILERGDFVPQEAENWNPEAVWKHLRYQTKERWIDERGEEFRPYTHYNVGGNTKFWGSVLYRLRREDFQPLEHMEGVSPGWPIDYDTLAPYYERAERLYHVHGELGTDPTEPAARHVSARADSPRRGDGDDRRAAARAGAAPVPAAARHSRRLRPLQHVQLVRVQGAREERGGRLLRAPRASSGRTSTCGPTRTRGGCSRIRPATGSRPWRSRSNGETVRVEASVVVVSCGAVNSAALLLRSANDKHPNGLANSSGLVGRRYMAHLATMMQGFHPFRKNATVFQKTVAINDFYFHGPNTTYPLGQIQSQGRTHGVMAQTVVPQVPLSWYEWWVARGVDWLAMSEDLPAAENRVTLDAKGRIQLLYRPNNLKAHRMLVAEARRILYKLGFWVVMTHSHGAKNTTHQCGTIVFGDRSARVGARYVLPRARRRESVRRRRVVLPLVRRRQPGADDRRAGAARRRSHQRSDDRIMSESSIVQPCRHHGVGLQQGREVLLGGLRLSARRRRRYAARSRADVFRRRRTTRRRARSDGFACRAAACSRSSSSSRSGRPGPCPGTASG